MYRVLFLVSYRSMKLKPTYIITVLLLLCICSKSWGQDTSKVEEKAPIRLDLIFEVCDSPIKLHSGMHDSYLYEKYYEEHPEDYDSSISYSIIRSDDPKDTINIERFNDEDKREFLNINQDITIVDDVFFFNKHIMNPDFHNAVFNELVSLVQCTITGNIDFTNCKFNNGFCGSIPSYTTYDSVARFNVSSFNGTCYFKGDKYNADLEMIYSKFTDLEMDECTAMERVLLRNSTFTKSLNFKSSYIKNTLDLRNISLTDTSNIYFNNTLLPDTILLTNIQNIANEIDLTLAKFTDSTRLDINSNEYKKERKHLISLYKTDISQIKLDYTHFKLITVNTEREDWAGIFGYIDLGFSPLPKDSTQIAKERQLFTGEELPYDEVTAMYEALLENFKSRGQKRSYQLCDIEYQEYIYSKKPAYKSWLVVFPKYWNNFGYDKDKVFGWAFLFLGVFTLLTFFMFDTLTRTVYPIRNIPIQPKWQEVKHGLFTTKIFWNRLWYSFVYTSVVFFLISLKVGNIDYRKKGYVFYLMSMYTLGIICLAYMANFIITR